MCQGRIVHKLQMAQLSTNTNGVRFGLGWDTRLVKFLYKNFFTSCRLVQFARLVDVFQVVGDGLRGHAEQLGHARLGHPQRLVLQQGVHDHAPVRRRIRHNRQFAHQTILLQLHRNSTLLSLWIHPLALGFLLQNNVNENTVFCFWDLLGHDWKSHLPGVA